jgi:hypothetical protein
VNRLNEKIRNIQKEIKKIQDDCEHKDKKIEMDKKGSPKWTCTVCKSRVSYPSSKELRDFFDK